MPSTRQLDETITAGWRLHGRSGWRVVGQSGIADSVGKCQQIVGAWLGLLFDAILITSQPRGADSVCACDWQRS
jgi:hypothetical protein